MDFQNPIDLNGADRTVRVANGAADVDAVLSGAITGGFSLIKAGAGTLRLDSHGNTFAGDLDINSGTVKLGAADVIPNFAVNIRRGGGTNDTDGMLDLNGFSDTIAILSLGDTSTNINNVGQTVSLINTGSNQNAVLTVVGNITYFFGLGLNLNGKAKISANISFACVSRTIAVGDGASVDDLEISGAISNGAGLTFSGLGTTVLSNPANVYTNTGTTGGETLKLGADNVLGTGTLTLNQGSAGTSTLDLNGKTHTIEGAITLSGASTTALGATNRIIDSAGGGLLRLNSGTVTCQGGSVGFNNGTTTISANLDLNSASAARTFATTAIWFRPARSIGATLTRRVSPSRATATFPAMAVRFSTPRFTARPTFFAAW